MMIDSFDMAESRERCAFKAFYPKKSWHVFYFGGSKPKVHESPDYRTALNIADKRYSKYKEIYVPAENYAIDEAVNYNNEDRINQVSGQASAAVQNSFSKAISSDLAALQQAGVNPGSAKFKTAISDGAADEALAISDNVNRTQTALEDEGVRAKKNVIALGNNQATESLAGINSIAIESQRKANRDTMNDFQEDRNRSSAIGGAAGMAARAAIGDDE